MARAADRGQAVPLLVAVVAVGVVVLLVAGRLVARWADAARARTAADAGALACLEAGGAGGVAAARAASGNGGRLLAVAMDGASCTVRVRVGEAAAEATAAWRPRAADRGREDRHAG